MTATTYVLDLRMTKPPLNLNDRMHWAQRASITKDIRLRTRAIAGIEKLPKNAKSVKVRMMYRPRDKRRRDPSNLILTQKPALDGLVDYGLIPDDSPEYVEEMMPTITQPIKGQPGKVWLEVTIND